MKANLSRNELPEQYHLKIHIDMKANPAEFWGIQLGSLLLLIPFIFPIIWGWIPALRDWDLVSNRQALIYVLLLQVPMMIAHEWLHGIVYKQGTDRKVVYKFHGFAASASVPGTYFYLRHYQRVGLAPAVVLNALFLVLTLISSGQWQVVWYLMLAVHFASCVGDFYVSLRIRTLPVDTLIEDYGVGMKVYVRQ